MSDDPSYFDDEQPISRASCLLILVFAALAWGAVGVIVAAIAAIIWRIPR